MLKNKKLIGLLVVFGALLAFAAAKKIFEGERAVVDESIKEKQSVAVVTENFPIESVTQILFYKGASPDRKIELKKGDKDSWLLSSRYGIPVKKETAANFLRKISNIKGDVRATSKNVFSDFKIGDKEGLHIILKNIAGKDILHLVTGGVVPRWGVYFIRRSDSEKVVMAEGEGSVGGLGFYFLEDKLDDRSLGDYHLFGSDVPKADRLEVALFKKETCVLVKSDTWKLEPPQGRETVDPAKVEGFLRILSEMTGRDVVDPKGAGYGLESPQAIVKVTVKEGAVAKMFEVQLGGPVANEGMFYVRVLPANFVYKVPENAALNLKQNKAYFLQTSPKKK